jgi:hypothetical protein
MTGHLRRWPRPYDAVVVVDADSVLNEDFLWFMDEALAGGREVLQGYYGVENPAENWRSSLMTASLAAFHFLRPLGRDRWGLSVGLKGNGMCFARRLVETYGYPAFSVVEDVELALYLLQRGLRVRFVPGAHVYGQMAVSREQADVQRSRWEGGRLELMRRYLAGLLRDGARKRDPARLDAAVDLCIPPFTTVALYTGAGWALALGLLAARPGAGSGALAALWTAALAAEAAYVLFALVLARVPPVVYRRLVFAPFFAAWKVALYARMIARPRAGPRDWERTGRHEMKR